MALIKLSRLNQRRWQLFRRNKRGYWSFVVFMILFVLSIFAPFIANDRPIIASYKGEMLYPLLVDYPESKFGGFLDSTLDRASEAVVYFGLLYAYLNTTPPATVEPLLIFIATVGSLLVSYTRARVEGLGATMKDGWFTRLERIVVLVVGLVLLVLGVMVERRRKGHPPEGS